MENLASIEIPSDIMLYHTFTTLFLGPSVLVNNLGENLYGRLDEPLDRFYIAELSRPSRSATNTKSPGHLL